MGFGTPVVYAANDECSFFESILVSHLWDILKFCVKVLLGNLANALNIPPGEYGRKIKTQRNWRGPLQAVEHVV